MKTKLKKTSKNFLVMLLVVLLMVAGLPQMIFAAGLDFKQLKTKGAEWINGNLNQNNSYYVEGMSTPQRLIIDGIGTTAGNVHSATLSYQFTKGGKYAYDFLTSWDQAVDAASAVGGVTWSDSWKWLGAGTTGTAADWQFHTTGNIPEDGIAGVARENFYESVYGDRVIDVYSDAAISNVVIAINPTLEGSTASDSKVNWTITWTGAATKVMILYAGHIAIGLEFPSTVLSWGAGMGAGGISGSPYHHTLVSGSDWTGGSSMDNQMQASAIVLKSGISGMKWLDLNADGIREPNGVDGIAGNADDEIGLSGWEIWVDLDGDGVRDPEDVSVITGADGTYSVDFILTPQASTTVKVREVLKTDWEQTFPTAPGTHSVTIAPGVGVTNINFGNRLIPKFPIEITKVDPIGPLNLQGAVFGIYSDSAATNLLQSITTGSDGKATSKEFVAGTYYVKEITPPTGYVADNTIRSVTITNSSGKISLTINNVRTPYPIGVFKQDAISGAPLAGVVFGLYNGNTGSATLLETLPATNASGYAQTVNNYAPGTYYLKEISTVNGYVLNPSFHPVTVTINQAGGVATITVTNNRTPYPIGVFKKDAINNAPLAGVVFGLYNGNTGSATLLETLPATNASGYAQTVNTYAPGSYYLKEISTINGYELNPNFYPVTVNIGQAGGVATITVYNERTPYPIGVFKKDAISDAPMAGVIFGLYNGNTGSATLLETLPATNASGYAQTVNNYAPGTYYLKEISTINGYVLNPNFYPVTVAIGQAGGVATITVSNNRTPYPIGVFKKDAISDAPLAGVIFGLYNGNTGSATLLETLPATNASGYAQTVNNYAPGTYYLKEISTINGYVLNPNFYPVTVNIAQTGGLATITVYNERTPYPIGVFKKDAISDAPLAGVIFGLYNGNTGSATLLETLPATNASGYAQTVNNYAPGTYYLKEISTINGYVLNPNFYPVTVNIGQAGGVATITVTNNRTPYPIGVFKKDAISDAPLAGVIFGLYNGNTGSATLLETLPATNASGYAQTVNNYAPGTYYLKEISTINGYELNPNFYPVTVNIGQAGGVATITVYNNRTPYPIGVFKKDAISDAPLAGVIFGLYNGNTGSATLLETLPATNASGYAQTVNNYAPGTYYLKEISTINGYELNPNFYPVTVNIGQAGGVATITVYNERTPYPIGVYKKDAISEAPLAGVIFGLYDSNGLDAELLETLPATNASGYAQTVNNYAPGTYYLKEISTINGYELNPNFYPVTVNIGQAGGVATITVYNERTPYPIGVYKKDAISEAPLAGVIFGLYDSNDLDAELLETLPATNASGYAQTVSNYAPGTYYLKEISTINGYVLDTSFHAVTVAIGQAGGVATITVFNDRERYPIEITKLDATNDEPLAGFTFRIYKLVLDVYTPVSGDLVTGANGVVTSDPLAPGQYFVHETAAPNGYDLDSNYYPVTVNIGQENNKATITVRNPRTPYPIGVYKLDEISDEPLAGVIFGLYDSNAPGAALLETLPATNASGYAQTVSNYAPGTYYLREISTINGYELDTDFHAVTVNIAQAGGVATITVYNDRTPYKIQIIKLDQRDETTLLAGAVFELRAAVEVDSEMEVGALLEVLTTDATGQATTVNKYAPGQYFLVETSAPAGFHPITVPILVTLSIGAEPNDGILTIRILDNFINEPSISVNKLVANITRGPLTPSDLADLYVGETAQYTVDVTNNGNVELTDVILTDDQIPVGTSVESSRDGTLTWQAGVGGIATLNIGDMAVGETITLTYDYVTVADDLIREVVTNTAVATGQMEPTPDYPDGTEVSDEDPAVITITDIPLNRASITLVKLVQNLTKGGAPAEMAGGNPGDVFRYTVTIRNTGSLDLTLVKLTDDKVSVGGTIKNVTAGTTLTWLDDGGTPYLPLDDLAPGESVTFTYEYTSTTADLDHIRTNIAEVEATVAITLDDPDVIVLNADDNAQIAVEQIPITGENGGTTMAGLALLFGAAALVLFRRRRQEHDPVKDESDEI